VISPGAYVSEGAVVRDSVIMNDTWIGPGAQVDSAVIDKEVYVAEDVIVGHGDDNTPNQELPNALNTGLTVIGKGAHLPRGARLGRNVVIQPFRQEGEFAGLEVESGKTI